MVFRMRKTAIASDIDTCVLTTYPPRPAPNHFFVPETGCVSLIKAMAMGAIPITSRFPNSTLPELTSEWDMGPREALASHYKVSERCGRCSVQNKLTFTHQCNHQILRPSLTLESVAERLEISLERWIYRILVPPNTVINMCGRFSANYDQDSSTAIAPPLFSLQLKEVNVQNDTTSSPENSMLSVKYETIEATCAYADPPLRFAFCLLVPDR